MFWGEKVREGGAGCRGLACVDTVEELEVSSRLLSAESSLGGALLDEVPPVSRGSTEPSVWFITASV